MKVTAETSLEELAFIVSTELEKNGFSAVLCGGGAVSIYTKNEYQSGDLDFVTAHANKDLAVVMKALGFKPSGRSFVHDECQFYVEFPPSPVMLGGELSKGPHILTRDDKTLKLLSPTESVMDRLMAYLAWRDPQSLDQAVMICRQQSVDLVRIKKWAKAEGFADEFAKIQDDLVSKS